MCRVIFVFLPIFTLQPVCYGTNSKLNNIFILYEQRYWTPLTVYLCPRARIRVCAIYTLFNAAARPTQLETLWRTDKFLFKINNYTKCITVRCTSLRLRMIGLLWWSWCWSWCVGWAYCLNEHVSVCVWMQHTKLSAQSTIDNKRKVK